MSSRVEILGIYPCDASEPVHLVELIIRNCSEKVSLYDFTQEVSGQERANWQVPYDEKILNEDGTAVKSDPYLHQDLPEDWIGDVRMVFFFHYLDLEIPLLTPFGDVQLSGESSLPPRLDFIEYEPPY